MKKLYTLTLFFTMFFFSQVDAQTTHIVEMQDNFFVPANITINVGDTIEWPNVGNVVHTSTSGVSCTSDGTWDSGNVFPGGSYSFVFTESGEFPYYCIPHCAIGMTGSVTVEEATATDDVLAENNGVLISPNPAETHTTVEFKTNSPADVSLTVFNLTGKQLEVPYDRTERNNDRITFDLNLIDLTKGMYFVQLKSAGSIQTTQRLVVQ